MFSIKLATAACAAVTAFTSFVHADTDVSTDGKNSLAQLALSKVLSDASPVFGIYENEHIDTARWMSKIPDSMPIVHMNIPGTHDAATWNYSAATMNSLLNVDALANFTEIDYQFLRCQNMSMINMLNMGIRAFDLRPALDVTNTTLVFYHSTALQSETATMDDVLFGFYKWLQDHPTEALFLSFQYEHGNMIDAQSQMALYNSLTTPWAQKYILQTKDSFGTLGEARGKITLLRRFDLDLLPPFYANSIPGLHFSPNAWIPNQANLSLVYNNKTGATAYIEDHYNMLSVLPIGATAAQSIGVKFNDTKNHLYMAASSQWKDSFFWTFASSHFDNNFPPEYPIIQALGNGSTITPLGGVNQQILPVIKSLQGKRMGMVMFDFFEIPSDLVKTLLSMN